VLPAILIESEEKISQTLRQYKRKDKTIQEYIQYLVGGITVGTPEKIVKGLNEYANIGVNHIVIHFIKLDEQILKEFTSKVITKM
jgi:alkanesulfonate monooxygenase SsuD/methylene tetrahydromethanopterin reductase-like flavin-dependent oxidoreductase (luciferase family)